MTAINSTPFKPASIILLMALFATPTNTDNLDVGELLYLYIKIQWH
jgi:hypothetical protein